jgi:hypothetical protein
MLGAVDAHEILGDKVLSNRLYGLASLERHRSFARVLSLQVISSGTRQGGVKRGASHFCRPVSVLSCIGSFAYYNRARDVLRGISRWCAQALFAPIGVLSFD